MFKKGDVVVFTDDQFNVPRKVTRVLKDGRVQIGKWIWPANSIRKPTDEELQLFLLKEKAKNAIEDLRGYAEILEASEIETIVNILGNVKERFHNLFDEEER